MKNYIMKKYIVQDTYRKEGNIEKENMSILYVCLTDDKFIRSAKSTFYVAKTVTSETEKYTALKMINEQEK